MVKDSCQVDQSYATLHHMANRKKIPYTDDQLRRLREKYTDTEIIAMIEDETGERISPGTISARAVRMGFAKDTRTRRSETLPWRLSKEQRHTHWAGRLATLGRRLAGEPVSELQSHKLDAFLRELERGDQIIGFVIDSRVPKDAFVKLPARMKDHDDSRIPIRIEPLRERDIVQRAG